MAGKMESFPSENAKGDLSGYVVGDSLSKQGLIVIHEWWGQNEQIKTQGADFAKDGNFRVLVPDLYRGKVAEDNETAGHLMNNLDWQGAIKDISAAAKFLKSRGCVKVGVTGFCMGGALAFASAALIPGDISAAAPFYGIPSVTLCDLATIKIPVQCHFGAKDTLEGFSSKKDYDPLMVKLKEAGVDLEYHEYDAGHAFCNPANRIGPNHDIEAAKLSASRMFEFMNKNLQ